ncbi:sugar phosphate isomerase/epimerase family protein [Rhodopirellula halodulae]|uniref:sugar phosphate isomerase/epimerase family protein n=1 Tax=Rhodopirellula halodulae TaxID=2894198 RepID=UPI001E4C56A8|nr:sugar phosphate isomerase/epimerase family protein [Rhodopirellula sp. JC737]MCC9654728.1 sugar phosphate isomerase/epimerase [Rhodopirellula sp. JC737]
MPMTPGYHTSGLLLHDPIALVEPLASMGYRCVAVRPRQGMLASISSSPGALGNGSRFEADESSWERLLQEARLHRCQLVIDTESSFLLDDESASMPCLADSDEERVQKTLDWIQGWIRLAEQKPGTMVTFGSGVHSREEFSLGPSESDLEHVASRIEQIGEYARRRGVVIALRPASGHAVASVAEFERICQWLPESVELGLAADLGEMVSAGEMPLGPRLQRNAERLKIVYLCDHRWPGQPPRDLPPSTIGRDDTPIGKGELSVRRVTETLGKIGFEGPAVVRVEGHCEQGLQIPRLGMQHLMQCHWWQRACQQKDGDESG